MRSSSFLFLALLAFSGCSRDPSTTGEVACCPEVFWYSCAREEPSLCPSVTNAVPLTEEGAFLEVDALLDIGLSNNPTTKETWAAARASAYSYRAAKSICYPSLDLTETVSHIGEENGTVGSEFGVQTGSGSSQTQLLESELALSYLLFDFGGRKASIESARQALYSANWTHNRSLQTVVLDILQAYYEYLDAKANLKAKRSDLLDAEKSVEAAEVQYRSGISTHVDLLQAKTNLLQVQLELEQAEGTMHTNAGMLAASIGLPANQVLNVGELPKTLPLDLVTQSVENLMEEAKEMRPDFAAIQANVREKKAIVTERRSERLPSLSVLGSADKNTVLNDSRLSGHYYQLGVSLTMPLFSGFLYRNKIANAQAELEEAYAQMENKELGIFVDVVTSYYQLDTAAESVRFSRELLDYSTQTYEMALAGYRQGVQTILDLLNAQKNLSTARSEWVRARSQWMISLANLAYATGTLSRCEWREMPLQLEGQHVVAQVPPGPKQPAEVDTNFSSTR